MSELNKDIKIFTDINFNDIDYQPSAKFLVTDSHKFLFIKGKKYIVSYIGEYSFITKDENGSYIRTSEHEAEGRTYSIKKDFSLLFLFHTFL